MTREQIKKLSHSELIKHYERLLTQETFSCEDAITLRRLCDELSMRKDICVRSDANKRVTEPLACLTKSNDSNVGVLVNLIIMDKESISEIPGLKKYTLGYALDVAKKFEGENIIKVLETLIAEDFIVGRVLAVKAIAVAPVQSGKLYGVNVDSVLTFEATNSRVDSSIEILRKAHVAECLNITQETAAELNRCGILKLNIDEMFGIRMDKRLAIHKGDAFGKEGIFYSIVYPADEIDTDGDSATAEEVQKACWRFMEEHQRMNFMHKDDLTENDVSIVECAIALADSPKYHLKANDWYMAVRVKNKELRDQIEKGEITGFSMEGTAFPGD